jgi:hypothetical protein
MGSLEFYGDDVPKFIDLLIENFDEYIKLVKQYNDFDVAFEKLKEKLN